MAFSTKINKWKPPCKSCNVQVHNVRIPALVPNQKRPTRPPPKKTKHIIIIIIIITIISIYIYNISKNAPKAPCSSRRSREARSSRWLPGRWRWRRRRWRKPRRWPNSWERRKGGRGGGNADLAAFFSFFFHIFFFCFLPGFSGWEAKRKTQSFVVFGLGNEGKPLGFPDFDAYPIHPLPAFRGLSVARRPAPSFWIDRRRRPAGGAGACGTWRRSSWRRWLGRWRAWAARPGRRGGRGGGGAGKPVGSLPLEALRWGGEWEMGVCEQQKGR